jgi:outer membrane protein
MRPGPAALCLAILLIGSGPSCALAADDCSGPAADCVAVGHWNFSLSLGAGVRTNPVVHGADIPLVVIPQVSYYGKRVFLDNLDLGVTLAEGSSSTLNLIASPGYDRVFFYRSDLQNLFVGGLPAFSAAVPGGASSTQRGTTLYTTVGQTSPAEVQFPSRARHVTYLAGPEWTFDYHRITGQLDLLHEITGRNHGDEIRAALGIPLTQSRNALTFSLGLTWKSAAIVNYYYGAPNIYDAGPALNPFVKLGYARALTGKWRLTALLHYERLGSSIADSPIVSARYVATVFAGTTYQF